MHLVVELAARREAMVHRGAVVGCHHAAFVVCTRNARLFRGPKGVRRAADPARSALTLPPLVLVVPHQSSTARRDRETRPGRAWRGGAGSRCWSEAACAGREDRLDRSVVWSSAIGLPRPTDVRA